MWCCNRYCEFEHYLQELVSDSSSVSNDSISNLDDISTNNDYNTNTVSDSFCLLDHVSNNNWFSNWNMPKNVTDLDWLSSVLNPT